MSNKKTNGDNVRETLSIMTDEQLAFLFVRAECECCPARSICDDINSDTCIGTLLEYFKMEAAI